MTEAEWITSDDPLRMLEWLTAERVRPDGTAAGRRPINGSDFQVSDRKLRLFGVACVIAAGVGTEFDWQRYEEGWEGYDSEAWARRWAALGGNKQSDKANFIRTITGNPWRPVIVGSVWTAEHERLRPGILEPRRTVILRDWLTWKDGTVPKMAQVIYDERRWELMPMLADALEESGCRDEVILRWCRGEEWCWACKGSGRRPRWGDSDAEEDDYPCNIPACGKKGWIPRRGPSVRGDWVIDLLLGKE